MRASAIEVEEPGWQSTIQDQGRNGFRQFGMPRAGAMDPFSPGLGNQALGNPDDAAFLECVLRGPVLRFHKPVRMVLTGAVVEATLGDRPIRRGEVFQAETGDRLVVGRVTRGCRIYLCFGGGLAVAPVMGSRSTYLPAGIGGVEGRALRSGDVLDLGEDSRGGRSGEIPRELLDTVLDRSPIRIFPGPESDRLGLNGLQALLLGSFRVDGASNRVGYRLGGRSVCVEGPGGSQVSGPVLPGTIQVASDGQLLLLMADAQTTGGYPRIATVAAVDLPRVAQLAPGDMLSFREIGIDKAVQLLMQQRAETGRACYG